MTYKHIIKNIVEKSARQHLKTFIVREKACPVAFSVNTQKDENDILYDVTFIILGTKEVCPPRYIVSGCINAMGECHNNRICENVQGNLVWTNSELLKELYPLPEKFEI